MDLLSDTSLSFRDQGFLVSEGLHPRNVLDYFCESPFYFRYNGVNSLNEQVRRGAKTSLTVALEDTTHIVEWFELVFFNEEGAKGFVDESIFVIQKFHRQYASQKVPRQVFYVLSGTVYQALSLGKFTESICSKAITAFAEMWDANTPAKTENVEMKASDWPSFVKFPKNSKHSIDPANVATVLKAELKRIASPFWVSRGPAHGKLCISWFCCTGPSPR
jgi:hypothetical protein